MGLQQVPADWGDNRHNSGKVGEQHTILYVSWRVPAGNACVERIACSAFAAS